MHFHKRALGSDIFLIFILAIFMSLLLVAVLTMTTDKDHQLCEFEDFKVQLQCSDGERTYFYVENLNDDLFFFQLNGVSNFENYRVLAEDSRRYSIAKTEGLISITPVIREEREYVCSSKQIEKELGGLAQC